MNYKPSGFASKGERIVSRREVEDMDYGPDIIQRYLMHELMANALVKWDSGEYIFEGAHKDYLVEMKLYPLEKNIRLSEN